MICNRPRPFLALQQGLGLFVVVGATAFVFMVEVKANLRFRFRPRNFDWYLRTYSVLAEERIARLQQDRLPSARHLRKLGLEPRLAVKIKLSPIQTVIPRHLHLRSRN